MPDEPEPFPLEGASGHSGVNISTAAEITIGGDVVGRDKIVQHIQSIVQNIAPRALTEAEAANANFQVELRSLADGVREFIVQIQARASERADRATPYRGLLNYRLSDAEIFFGRKAAIADLVERLNNGPLTILHSESGVGKTSLLQAGISPHMITSGYVPVYLRPYNTHPTLVIKRAFMADLSLTPKLGNLALREFLRRVLQVLGEKSALYILLDQFEEFFTRTDEADQQAFVSDLAECLDDPALNIRWVLSLRAEYFSKLADLQPRIRNPFDNNYRLSRLTRAEAETVILQPAAQRGITFEDNLVGRLMDDLGQGKNDIAPAQMQLVCSALFDELEPGQTAITHTLYDREGGAAGILRDHLGRVLGRDIPAERRQATRRLLEALISSQQQRMIRPHTDLIDELGQRGVPARIVNSLLSQLVESRLLRVEETEQGLAYELAHDYLLDEIKLDPDVQARKAAQELLEQEVRSYLRYKTLLTADRLKVIEPYLKDLQLSREAMRLVAKSREAVQREQIKAEEQRQKELEDARKLAESERQRAEEQAQAADRLRTRSRIIAAVGLMAMVLAVVAGLFSYLANENLNAAQVAGAEALTQQAVARINEAQARANAATAEAAGQDASAQKAAAQAAGAEALTQQAVARTNEAQAQANAATAEAAGQDASAQKAIAQTQAAMAQAAGAVAQTQEAIAQFNATQAIAQQGTAQANATQAVAQQNAAQAQAATAQAAKATSQANESAAQAASTQAVAQKATAQANEALAVSRQLAAQALLRMKDRLELALLLGVEAYRAAGTLEARNSLFSGLQRNPRLVTYLYGLTDAVTSLAFSPDGKLIAGGGCAARTSDGHCTLGAIYLWDRVTHQRLGDPMLGHTLAVKSLAFSSDGKTIASGVYTEDTATIIFWDILARQPRSQPQVIRVTQADLQTAGPIASLAIHPSLTRVAFGHASAYISLWSLADGGRIKLFRDEAQSLPSGRVDSIAFNTDGSKLASGDQNRNVVVWRDLDSASPTHDVPIRADRSILSVALSLDGNVRAYGDDLAIRAPGAPDITGHTDAVLSLAVDPTTGVLASGDADGNVFLWELTRQQRLGIPLGGNIGTEFSVAFSPDGRLIATGGCAARALDGRCAQGSLSFWDASTRARLGDPFSGHADAVSLLAFSPDSQKLASSSLDHTVIMWGVATRSPIGEPLRGDPDFASSVAFSPDGRWLAFGGCASRSTSGSCLQGAIHLWDILKAQRVESLSGHARAVNAVAFSADSRTLASLSFDADTLILWDVGNRQALGELAADANTQSNLAFSPDSKLLASGGDNDELVIWEVTTRQRVGRPPTGPQAAQFVNSVAFSPDGRLLALGKTRGTLLLRDAGTLQPFGEDMPGHNGQFVNSLAFSPNSLTLASTSVKSGNERVVILWDLNPSSWQALACRIANRNLTPAEWTQHLGALPYRKTCEGLP